MLNWAVAGIVYAGAYAGLITALADHEWTRMLVGEIGMLLPPLSLIFVLVRRRTDWRGRQAVFWGAMGAWSILWLIGQLAWASDELLHGTSLPWFTWPIVVQLCASALPLIALLAWPHRGVVAETAITAALDVVVLEFLAGFLYWSLIIAPGMDPAHAPRALQSLATIGPLVRLAAAAGLLAASASAGRDPWAVVYRRMALGMLGAFAVLIAMSLSAVRGEYHTGSPTDVGWMLPFFFTAWAAAASPASPAASRTARQWGTEQSSPVLIFIALLAVPIVGYGSNAMMPVGERLDRMRELATAFTLAGGIALVMLRLRVERVAVNRANQRVRMLATACEQAGELIIVVRGQRIEYANAAFCAALGYSPEQLERVKPIDLVSDQSRPELPELRESLRTNRVVRANTVMSRRDGTTFPAAWVAALIEPSGDDATVVGVVRDMTDELRLRAQIVRGERLSAIGEFVSGVAHEINNPLQSIIGTLELVLAETHDAPLRSDLDRVRFEAGRAGRIVRNLLAFVRQSTNERVLIDLNETVKATLAVRSYELELGGIRLDAEYAPVLPLVLASPDEIQQVLVNLLINAQQAMADAEGNRVLSVRTHLIGSDAAVEISDSGPGIPDAIAGKIFEPFFTTRSIGSGTGLGLSTSLGIAHAHNGALELVPSPSGTCFRLTLPGAGFPGPAVANPNAPLGFMGPT
jgi:PAS domain S-box-containing protein